MARPAQPLEDYLRAAREDADFALKLLVSGTPEDAALLDAMLPDLAKALTNAAQGLKRRSICPRPETPDPIPHP